MLPADDLDEVEKFQSTQHVSGEIIARKHVELIEILIKLSLLHLVGCLYNYVFVDLGIQHAVRMRYIFMCGLLSSIMFFYIIS